MGKPIGFSANMIYTIEGDTRRPSPEAALQLARALQIAESELESFLHFAR